MFHLLEPDINQELYGMLEYLSALNLAWLNAHATLFCRKYYQNGAHASYIMYVTDAAQGPRMRAQSGMLRRRQRCLCAMS